LIEFAIVAPVLIVILAGVVVYGLYFATVHNVQQIAAEAARASIAGMDQAERRTLATQAITNTIGSYSLLKPDRISVAVAAMAADSNYYEVTVTYDASHLGIWSLNGLVPMPSSTIQRASTVRRGGL
jgi:Flp pilus assembly protein TadG